MIGPQVELQKSTLLFRSLDTYNCPKKGITSVFKYLIIMIHLNTFYRSGSKPVTHIVLEFFTIAISMSNNSNFSKEFCWIAVVY